MLEKKFIPFDKDNPGKSLATIFFGKEDVHNDKVTFGHIVFKPGARTPEEGYGVHEQDEYSYIISGEAVCVIDGKEYRSSAGAAMFIPAGEAHYSYNDTDEPCVIIWALIEK
jgi:quercetin dioxygenase-like cupin family protein